MKKRRLTFVMIFSVVVLALSFLLLKLEKKQTILISNQIFLKTNSDNTDSILQAYGSTIYQISPIALNTSSSPSLFLESKLYAPSVAKPIMNYCCSDSSLSITVYDKKLYPNRQDIINNGTRNHKLAAILLKYQ